MLPLGLYQLALAVFAFTATWDSRINETIIGRIDMVVFLTERKLFTFFRIVRPVQELEKASVGIIIR